MFRAFDPQWTKDGPLDAACDTPLNSEEKQHLHTIEKRSNSPHLYLPETERLVSNHPQWPYVVVRLARAHLLLEDLHGAFELFEKTLRLIGPGTDVIFENYIDGLRKYVLKVEQDEDCEWEKPEGGIIVSPWRPPRAISTFSFAEPFHAVEVMSSWNALQEEMGVDLTRERYARLVAIETNELENVFTLAGESLSRLVRVGPFSGAIDRVGPVGIQEPERIVGVIKDLQKALNYVSGSKRPNSLSENDIRRIHDLVIYSSRIGRVQDGEDVAYYLTCGGVYRKRLVYTSLTKESADEDEDDQLVQYTHPAHVAEEMHIFTDMIKEPLQEHQSPFALAAWIHATFARIHPFTDGNGRVARLIASLPLIRAGYPLVNVRPSAKDAYFGALVTAQTTDDLQPLVDVFAKSMLESIAYIRSVPLQSPDDRKFEF